MLQKQQFKKQQKQLVIKIGNKIADKITSVSKKKPVKELHNNDEDVEITTHKERYISPEER